MLWDFLREDVLLVDDPLEEVVFLLPEVPPDDELLEVDFLLLVLLLPVVAFLREDADEVLPEPVPESAVPVVAPASGITVSFPESEITFILTCLLPFLTRNPCVAGAAVWALTASVFCLMSSRSTAITPPAPAALPAFPALAAPPASAPVFPSRMPSRSGS